jgi:hypothetical protein
MLKNLTLVERATPSKQKVRAFNTLVTKLCPSIEKILPAFCKCPGISNYFHQTGHVAQPCRSIVEFQKDCANCSCDIGIKCIQCVQGCDYCSDAWCGDCVDISGLMDCALCGERECGECAGGVTCPCCREYLCRVCRGVDLAVESDSDEE